VPGRRTINVNRPFEGLRQRITIGPRSGVANKCLGSRPIHIISSPNPESYPAGPEHWRFLTGNARARPRLLPACPLPGLPDAS
jgi:hypothetical protein